MSLSETKIVDHSEQNIITLIKAFHENINLSLEYICTCCDQLWFRSSVVKCNPINYKICPQDILDTCITGVQFIDNTECRFI